MKSNKEVISDNSKTNKSGHTFAKAPIINLNDIGRLRASNLAALLGVSRSTLYAGLASGRYPKNDGYDGRIPYWNTRTISAFLEA